MVLAMLEQSQFKLRVCVSTRNDKLLSAESVYIRARSLDLDAQDGAPSDHKSQIERTPNLCHVSMNYHRTLDRSGLENDNLCSTTSGSNIIDPDDMLQTRSLTRRRVGGETVSKGE